MIPWYSFVQPEDAEPEMWVGPYECYVEGRGYGPSAIDRAMTHTFMLQLDHERRFAVSQLELDCSTFTTEHCANVSRAIDYAVTHFKSYQIQSEPVSNVPDNPDLIGLSLSPLSVDYTSRLSEIQQNSIDLLSCADLSKTDLAKPPTSPRPTHFDNNPMSPSEPIAVDDDDDGKGLFQEDFVRLIRQLCKEKRKFSGVQPRKYSAKRIRKPNLHTVSEEYSHMAKMKRC